MVEAFAGKLAGDGYLDNGLLRFGSREGGTASLTSDGILKSPEYYNAETNAWYQLTYNYIEFNMAF